LDDGIVLDADLNFSPDRDIDGMEAFRERIRRAPKRLRLPSGKIIRPDRFSFPETVTLASYLVNEYGFPKEIIDIAYKNGNLSEFLSKVYGLLAGKMNLKTFKELIREAYSKLFGREPNLKLPTNRIDKKVLEKAKKARRTRIEEELVSIVRNDNYDIPLSEIEDVLLLPKSPKDDYLAVLVHTEKMKKHEALKQTTVKRLENRLKRLKKLREKHALILRLKYRLSYRTISLIKGYKKSLYPRQVITRIIDRLNISLDSLFYPQREPPKCSQKDPCYREAYGLTGGDPLLFTLIAGSKSYRQFRAVCKSLGLEPLNKGEYERLKGLIGVALEREEIPIVARRGNPRVKIEGKSPVAFKLPKSEGVQFKPPTKVMNTNEGKIKTEIGKPIPIAV